jgi:hypothetical protein
MDSEHWISRLAAAKRFYAAQLSHGGTVITTLLAISLVALINYSAALFVPGRLRLICLGLVGADRASVEGLGMHEEARPEFACPYCYDDHDVASLCVHLEEEHPFEPHAAVSVCLLWMSEVCASNLVVDLTWHA